MNVLHKGYIYLFRRNQYPLYQGSNSSLIRYLSHLKSSSFKKISNFQFDKLKLNTSSSKKPSSFTESKSRLEQLYRAEPIQKIKLSGPLPLALLAAPTRRNFQSSLDAKPRRYFSLFLKSPSILTEVNCATMDKFLNPKKRNKHSGGASSSDDDGWEDKLNPRHVTRANLFQKEKEKYLNMPIEEKRGVYKCRKRYLTLDDVQTWPQYAEESDIQPARRSKILFPYDEEINHKVSIWRGDITQLEIDAIANAANSSLLGGGGVDGAIHAAAGSSLRSENSTLKGCQCGDAKISGGYKLPARYVISTVGPMGHHEDRLRSCYTRCLDVMLKNKLRSLALPCISTGIYGYPNEDAAVVAMETVRKFLEKNRNKVDRIIFCLFLEKDVNIYSDFMPQYFPLESLSGKEIENESEEAAEEEMEVSIDEEETEKTVKGECTEKTKEGEENENSVKGRETEETVKEKEVEETVKETETEETVKETETEVTVKGKETEVTVKGKETEVTVKEEGTENSVKGEETEETVREEEVKDTVKEKEVKDTVKEKEVKDTVKEKVKHKQAEGDPESKL